MMKNDKPGKEVKFSHSVSVKTIDTGVEFQADMKTESLHRKAKKIGRVEKSSA